MISAIFAAAAILASGATANAPATDTAQPAAAEKSKADARGDQVICKTEQVLGTRFPKRICRTRAAIEAQRESDRQAISKIQSEQRIGP